MNISNNPGEKITRDPLLPAPATILIWSIIIIQILVSICSFPFLPAVVPTHWNAAGQVDGHASKWVNTILFPLLSIGLYVLIRGLTALGPHLGKRESTAANAQLVTIILVIVFLFDLILQICITAVSLGKQIDITFVAFLAVGVLFIAVGNYLGKIRRNFWMGIRTPWTLASEAVWERTHRVGGWLFVACGLLCIPLSFFPTVRLWGFLGLIAVLIVFSCGYSYFCYQQLSPEGREPLSTPFGGNDRD